jgi:hypothetical protein
VTLSCARCISGGIERWLFWPNLAVVLGVVETGRIVCSLHTFLVSTFVCTNARAQRWLRVNGMPRELLGSTWKEPNWARIHSQGWAQLVITSCAAFFFEGGMCSACTIKHPARTYVSCLLSMHRRHSNRCSPRFPTQDAEPCATKSTLPLCHNRTITLIETC